MSARSSAVLLLDLEGLKSVNDVHGHAIGDSVLAECARRLVTALRATDIVARLDGSTFGILLSGLPKNPARAAARAQEIAATLATRLAAPINMDGRLCHLTASIGIVIWPTEHTTAEAIMRSADVAMHVAKSSIGIEQGCRVAAFEAAMQEAVTSRRAIEAELRSALDENRLEVWLQPQVDGAGRAVGAEGLVRLRSRDSLLLAPAVSSRSPRRPD